ncbi:MAG: CDP-glycerol glycerophosphotransferase [Christiangramia sp.]|uniref:CDP-glycerol glycerophosphotransferase n=1 Tax=Christiangramia sp. TaxID=1931228 RepID=UPI003241DA5D
MTYRFLIYISHTYALPIGRPLQEEIKLRGYEVKWFCDNEYPKSHFPENGELLDTVDEVLEYDPQVVLTATDHVADFFSGLKVQVFHGFPANKRKGTDQFTIRGFFDLYCTQGPSSTKPFQEQQKKYQSFEVIETGWSKIDPLFPLENGKTNPKNVLISSTFTKYYSLALKEDVVEEILRLSKTGKWHFDVVLHPKLPEGIKQKFREMQHENLKYHDTTNLIPLFKKAHLMLSDTTSALIEFVLQRKPVVTIDNNMPQAYMLNIQNASEIADALEKAAEYPEALLKEIDKFAEFSHPYEDGRSSARVIDACIDCLHRDKSHLKTKPLNLIRRYKIRKKLGFFTWKSYRKPYTL